MSSTRMEAFSDAVLAILITIMVLELRPPEGTDLEALRPLVPVFVSYVLSFVYIAIYWNNHHHLLQTIDAVDGAVLWANMHLLFWLSLLPFVTAWAGENDFASVPMAVYGVVLLGAAVAYVILQTLIVRRRGRDSALARALGRDLKGRASPLLYVAGIPLSLVSNWLGFAIYAFVALMWLIPDRRLEALFRESSA